MLETKRRKFIGASMLGLGTILSGCGMTAVGDRASQKGRLILNNFSKLPRGLIETVNFPLIDAIHGRRSRRFARGASIPGGPLKYTSKHKAASLSELEEMLILTAVAGNTGWSNLIPCNRGYLPKIPNYAGSAGGRTFPSAAGFHTSNLLFTNDSGAYFMSTRDMDSTNASDSSVKTDLAAYIEKHKSRIVKLSDGRVNIPASPAHMEMHNEWCANVEGSTLITPVADLAQHHILSLCYLVQNGACIYDDINNKAIPGLGKFRHLVDVENPYPLSFVEQNSLTEVTVETSTACYAGALMLQATGLGGWMYSGINSLSVLGASGDPNVPGFGFQYQTDERWLVPNVTGLDGVFEGHCPPHFSTMRGAIESVVSRKYGSGGPFNDQTPGPYKNNPKVRSNAAEMNEEFLECVTTMAQYTFDRFGKFPATVPSMYAMMHLQAHQLDTDFYDHHQSAGSYLKTHKEHGKNWAGSVK